MRRPRHEAWLRGIPRGRTYTAAELVAWVRKRHPRAKPSQVYAAVSRAYVRGYLSRERAPFAHDYTYRSPA